MGVKDLWKILDENNIGVNCQLDELHGLNVAVDISGWIVQSEQANYGRPIKKPHIRNIFWKIFHLLQHQVKPVFVIDGKPSKLKQPELERRRQLQFKSLSNDDIQTPESQRIGGRFKNAVDECCELLDCLGLPWLQSENEAEAMCSWLNNEGVVSGVISDDSDCFLYGGQAVYRHFTAEENKGTCTKYIAKEIQNKIGLSRDHLISLALLLGCDYNYQGVHSIGKEYAMKWLKTLAECGPMERFSHWQEDKDHYEKLESYKSPKKPAHCKKCKHIGGVVNHSKCGCNQCRTEADCVDNNDITCACEFHNQKALYNKHATELKIRREALKDPLFPNKEIMNTFLEPVSMKEPPTITWRPPDYIKLKSFLQGHLTGNWDSEKCDQLIFKIKVARALDITVTTKDVYPNRIIKNRCRQGKDLYEVEWQEEGATDNGKVIVSKKLFSIKYPDMTTKYEASLLKKPRKKKPSNEPDLDQSTMKDFFKVKKVKRQLFPDEERAAKKGKLDLRVE